MKIMELGQYHQTFLNYECVPEQLSHFVPPGTEMDLFEGKAVASVIAATHQKIVCFGIPVGGDEIFFSLLLRTYVKRRVGAHWERGFVNLEHWVSQKKLQRTLQWMLSEKSALLSIERNIFFEPHEKSSRGTFEYKWKEGEKESVIRLRTVGVPQPALTGYIESFTSDRFAWHVPKGHQHKVILAQHEPWYLWEVDEVIADFSWPLDKFRSLLAAKPTHSFVAKGSRVQIYN